VPAFIPGPPKAWRIAALLPWFAAAAWAENPAATLEAPTVEVVGTTPLPSVGAPLEQVPAAVQAATGEQIRRQQALDLSDFMERNLAGVTVNAAQANPFQPDLSFRGFSASPLLGTPQGLSVFVDGVRVNEAFGDTVNWDLIPRSAISSINLIPGSNPLFGLNTLGGALAVHTKSGFQYPGFAAQALAGSWDRRAVEFEYGGFRDRVDWFVTGNLFDEDGWREHSPSKVRQLFGKLGFEDDVMDLDASFTHADNTLEGVQALPLSMLGRPEQAYTWPDRTRNRLNFFSLKGSRVFGEDKILAANVYYRRLYSDNFSSNVNDEFDPVTSPNPAFNDLSVTDQRGYGGSVQWTLLGRLLERANQFTLGASLDRGETDFSQFEQEAAFTPDRGTVATGDFELETDVNAVNRYAGLYFTDTLSLTERLHLTVSGRYNRARLRIRDKTGLEPALNGDHTFSRFNPAAGVAYNPVPSHTLFLAYNEGMRAPTPVELTCADPLAPCRLPNAFLADPPLKEVVSKTWEAGLRGRVAGRLGYSLSLYRTHLQDDIQFVSSGGAINAGFFQNVGTTRRQGLELTLQADWGRLRLLGSYSFIDATFRTPFLLNSPNNSSAQPIQGPSDIQVRPGDRIPGIPRHVLKLRAEYSVSEALSLGASLQAASRQFARGDENNQDVHGPVPGYAVLNLDARYLLSRRWELFFKLNNLLDERYENFGVLGQNFFRGPGNTFDPGSAAPEQFRSPGAPRAAWVGLRYALGGGAGGGDD